MRFIVQLICHKWPDVCCTAWSHSRQDISGASTGLRPLRYIISAS